MLSEQAGGSGSVQPFRRSEGTEPDPHGGRVSAVEQLESAQEALARSRERLSPNVELLLNGLYKPATAFESAPLDLTRHTARTQRSLLHTEPGPVREQPGSAPEARLAAAGIHAPNAVFPPSDVELYERAARLTAAEFDITNRQQLLSTMLRSVSEGVVIVDRNGHVLMENEAAIRIVGYSARLVGGKRWCEAVGACLVDSDQPVRPEDMPTMRACRGEEVRGVELALRGVDGDRNILIEVRSSPLVGVDGEIAGAIANFNDITERRRAAAVEGRLAALVRSTHAAVITWDSAGKVVDWNDGATRLLGYAADEMVGRDLSVLAMAGERRELGRQVNPTEALYDHEMVMRRKDGRPVHVAWTEAPVHDAKGNFLGSAGVGTDLSEHTRLERQVARLADEERRQLGRQVHDSLGQQLTAIGMLVGTLRSRLVTAGPVADVTSCLECCVDTAKAQMRAILKGLSPLKIVAHELLFALEELARGTALTHQIECRFECPYPVALDDSFTANELYLIAREAVHNAIKHGSPGTIVIRLESSEGLLLEIRDDGVGISGAAGERRQEGFGLRIMRYRSRLIGAAFKVARGANGGTVVTCTRTNTCPKGWARRDAERLPMPPD